MKISTHFAPLPGLEHRKGSTGLEASRVLKVGEGHLVSLLVYNSSGSDVFVQLFDAAAVPADGVAPDIAPFKVAAGATAMLELPATGLKFGNGIVVCGSSTDVTKAVVGNVMWFTAVLI